MTLYTNAPLITQVDLRGKTPQLGQIENTASPVKINTFFCNATSPDPVKAGYGVLSNDGILVARSLLTQDDDHFVGFCVAKSFDEGNVATNPYSLTMSDRFSVPVLQKGCIWVYNSSPILPSNVFSYGLELIVEQGAIADPKYVVGSVVQGTANSAATYLHTLRIVITNYVNVKTFSTTAQNMILLEVNLP